MASIAQNKTSKQHDGFSPSSSFIELVEYDAKNQSMKITFTSGTVKQYQNVGQSAYLSFKQSPTHDAYFNKMIRGKLPSSTIVDASIGKKVTSPLHKNKRQGKLDNGLSRQGLNATLSGTVNRALAGAGRI